ncbi:MAG: DNA repair protein RadC [Treponema sp.]|jgi:DNA repair protein RadC|nr:DNA repair protein RadC [Treponema sp.]
MNDFNYPDCSAEARVRYAGKRFGQGVLALPPERRPRERLLANGPVALSDAELLSILLNTGTRGKPVSILAEELLGLLDRNKDIPPVQELSRLAGMGNTKAASVAAMLEFGRRRWGSVGTRVKHPLDIFSLVRHNADRKQERFISISLNGAHEAMAVRVVTIGLVNRTIVHPREVFADLIQDRAAAFAVAHNHPSGKLRPSPEDDEITDRLRAAADILGLHFLDHLIFSEKDWWSYRQNGRIRENAADEELGPVLRTASET